MLKPGLLGAQWDEYINPSDLDGTRVDDGSANVNDSSAASGSGANSAPSSSIWDDLLDAGEKIWTSPNTALGLIAGMAGVPFGAKPTFEHGAVVFNDYPFAVNGGGALTLGNAILSTEPQLTPNSIDTYETRLRPKGSPLPPNPKVDMGNHEEGHVHQAEALGPLYLHLCLAEHILGRSLADGKGGGHLRTNRQGMVAMVRKSAVVAIVIGTLSFPAWSFEKVDGPRFFNATAHDIQLRATFTSGDDFSVTLIPGALGTYWDARQVVAIDVDEGGGNKIHLSGPTLPTMPASLSKPYDQIWLIDDSQVCVGPRHNFDRDKHPKC